MVSPCVKVTTVSGVRRARKSSLVQKLPNEIAAKKTLKNPGRWTREVVFVFSRDRHAAWRGGSSSRVKARGCTREGWEEDERSSLVARVPLVFPVVRHDAVRGDARRRPARGLLARIDVLRHHRCALPRVRGRAERAGGHAEPARGHALVHEPEELPGGVQRRRGGGILRPQRHAGRGPRRDASRHRRARWRRLRDVRGGGGRARRCGRGGRRGGPGRGRGERPTGPAHGGRTHGRATSASPDARPSVPSARGVPRRMPLLRP